MLRQVSALFQAGRRSGAVVRVARVTRTIYTTVRIDDDIFVIDKNTGSRVSGWHDIKLFPSGDHSNISSPSSIFTDAEEYLPTLQCVIETPRGSINPLQLGTHTEMNPLQFQKKGQLDEGDTDLQKGTKRSYASKIPFNAGILPQTWSSPEVMDRGYPGSGRPLEVIEIGTKRLSSGQVVTVAPLGMIGALQNGRINWKMLVINSRDHVQDPLYSIEDVDVRFPRLLGDIREWLRMCLVHENLPRYTFAFDEDWQDWGFGMEIIGECHKDWKVLLGLEPPQSTAQKDQGSSAPNLHRRPWIPK
mmetsp:Transcript_1861/g.2838  ORF Transcript_1861/g.2838 Transcript_1861/m.2838 type:complete len:303 (-) Transcript_1861:40-948(-)